MTLRFQSTALASLFAASLTAGLANPAFAEGGGDREPAGGAFNSSYSQNPYRSDARPGSIYDQPAYGTQSTRDPVTTGSVRRAPRRTRQVR